MPVTVHGPCAWPVKVPGVRYPRQLRLLYRRGEISHADRFVEVEWAKSEKEEIQSVRILATTENRTGMLAGITNAAHSRPEASQSKFIGLLMKLSAPSR